MIQQQRLYSSQAQLIQTDLKPAPEPFGITESDREKKGGVDHQGFVVVGHGSWLSSALRVPRIALFLTGGLDAALRANDSGLFGQWLAGWIQVLGEEAV